MPINMPTRVNRVPRLGQPAQSLTPVADAEREQIRQRIANAGRPEQSTKTYQLPGGSSSSSPPNRVPRLGQPADHQSQPHGSVVNPPASATGQPAYATGRGPLLHEQGTPLSNVPIRPSGQPATIDYNGIQLQRGPMAQAVITPPETWSDATHEALSPGYGLRQARNAAADSLSQRNMGIGGYGGMGGMSDGASARQAELINPMLAAHRQQQMRNGYGAWERGQLRLGGAKPEPDIVQSQEAPTLPTTSQYYTPREGVNYLDGSSSVNAVTPPVTTNPNSPDAARNAYSSQLQASLGGGINSYPGGITAVRNGNGSRLIGAGVSNQLFEAGVKPTDLIPGSPNYASAKRALDAITSQAENARIAAATPAGGLSRNAQYEQRMKDTKALRYAKQRPTSLAFGEAMGRVNQKQAALADQKKAAELAQQKKLQQEAFVQQQQQELWKKHLDSLPLNQRAKALQDMQGGSASPTGSLPALPAAPRSYWQTPQPVMPGRPWGGF